MTTVKGSNGSITAVAAEEIGGGREDPSRNGKLWHENRDMAVKMCEIRMRFYERHGHVDDLWPTIQIWTWLP